MDEGMAAGSDSRAAMAIERRLASEGLRAHRWGNGPRDRYAPHRHEYDKVIVVASGEITFSLPEVAMSLRLEVGDRLELPAGTLHAAVVGDRGVLCLEAHLATGKLPSDPRRLAGWFAGAAGEGET
jgi:quercetin dioxygenase-like cupin family protein